MTDQNETSRGGRPAIGPAISNAYPQELLDRVDAAAKRERTTRAQWLRNAAQKALPYRDLGSPNGLQHALAEADEQLAGSRDILKDPSNSGPEREFHAHYYLEYVTQLQTMLTAATAALPSQQEAERAFDKAERNEPEHSRELAQAWARTMAITTMNDLLDGLQRLMPINSHALLNVAQMPDPTEWAD